MITSKSNQKIKWVRRIQADRRFRHKEGCFVIEGLHWLKDLVQLEYFPVLSIATESWLQEPQNQSLARNLPQFPIPVSQEVMDHASLMESAPGILAALPIPLMPLPKSPTLLLILDRVANPGNLGSLLRTASAAGCSAVLLTPGCADPFNPKALRGGMGAQVRLPIQSIDWPNIRKQTSSLATYIASSGGSQPFYGIDWLPPSAIIIGSEASGPGKEALGLTQSEISIPMQSGVESLNAAVAGGIILFEVARQRARINRG